MPITSFFRDYAFDPEALKNMGDAFAEARKTLGLKGQDEMLTELVARRIIELARQGVQTKTALYLLTVQEFTANPQ